MPATQPFGSATASSRVMRTACLAFGVLAGACTSEKVTSEHSLSIEDERVRACDLLLDVQEAPVLDVHFMHARGSHFQRAPKLGVSFVALRDAPFPEGAVTLELGDASAPKLVSAACFDGLGQPVDAPGVKVAP